MRSLKTGRERVLLGAAVLGLVVLLIWVVSPAFAFADFTPRFAPLAAGIWSPTLELRESHQLVTRESHASGSR